VHSQFTNGVSQKNPQELILGLTAATIRFANKLAVSQFTDCKCDL